MTHASANARNVIVLTHGWTGSSAFSALFGEAGWWLGAETMQKPDYDTFENAGLVHLNNELLRRFAPDLNHEHRFSDADVALIEQRAADADLPDCRDFVAQCEQHRPWLWKDPRLTWTIRIWARWLDLRNTSFLVLTRDPTQAWITANLRRHVQSGAFTRQYNGGITRSNVAFLQQHGLPHLALSFEDLLLEPEKTLHRLNAIFGLGLSFGQLESVCKLPLRRKSRDWKDFAVALAIYLKNYGERDGRGRLAAAGSK